MTDSESLWCAGCAGERAFVVLSSCPDGHGADCPERSCIDCGAAVLVAGWPESSGATVLAHGRADRGRAQPSRHAA